MAATMPATPTPAWKTELFSQFVSADSVSARVFAAAAGSAFGGASRQVAAAIVAAAARTSPSHPEAGDEIAARAAVVEAGLRVQHLFGEDCPSLQLAIRGLRQLNKAVNDAKQLPPEETAVDAWGPRV